MIRNLKKIRPTLVVLALISVLPTLQACFPIVATGVVMGALIATDRRTVGKQTQDTEIEFAARGRVFGKYPDDNIHLTFVSFNGKLLVVGEVPTEEVKNDVKAMLQSIPNLEGIYDDMVIGSPSSLASRSTDTYITSKIKARQIDSSEFSANHVKVTTDARVVYLMGIVTQREAEAATKVARTTTDVKKVVTMFEIISSEEAHKLDDSYQKQQTNKTTPD